MRVILVEDNFLIQQLEVDILSASGHEVATAASAEEALQWLDEESEILIADIRLPGGMDGIALARVARQRRPDLAIMLIGADVHNFVPSDLGGIANELLGKPFTIDEFAQRLATLTRIVDHQASRRSRGSGAHR